MIKTDSFDTVHLNKIENVFKVCKYKIVQQPLSKGGIHKRRHQSGGGVSGKNRRL